MITIEKIIKKGPKKLKNIVFGQIYNYKKRICLRKISKISGLEIPKNLKKYQLKKISTICITPRVLAPNCIYFCSKGQKLNKEQKELIRKNASFVVTTYEIEGCKCIICDDPLKYLLITAKHFVKLSDTKVVTVTGSVGKTSTKEMIQAVLNQKYKNSLFTLGGNANTLSKILLNIPNISYNDKIYLQEIGAGSSYNSVKNPAIVLESDIAVYTNIRDNHIEWYKTRENILKEKTKLSEYGKKDGLAIINYDDQLLRNHKFKQKTLSYSLNNKKADYYAKNIEITSEGTSFVIMDKIENKEIDVSIELFGEQHVINSVVAYIIGNYFDIKDEKIVKGLKKYKTKGIRQNLVDLGKYKVLADCYNSSYEAMEKILGTFSAIKTGNGKKIAVIGDIFELGDKSNQIHIDLGKLVSLYELDIVIFYGELVKLSYDEYKKIKTNAIYVSKRESVIEEIEKIIKEDDIVLFKASHGMKFANIIDSCFGLELGETSAISNNEYILMEDNSYKYNVFDSFATIEEYKEKEEMVKLPKTFNNLPVEKLGRKLFLNNRKIKKVILSDNILRLKSRCFKNSGIVSVQTNKRLKTIGLEAFCGCKNLEEINFNEGLLIIASKAFANCRNLRKIVIPSSTKKISKNAFENSKNIVIYCHKGSYAEEYALNNNIKYEYIN